MNQMKILLVLPLVLSLTFVLSSTDNSHEPQQEQQLSQDEIEQMIVETEEHTRSKEMDQDLSRRFRARNKLESYAFWLANQIDQDGNNSQASKEEKASVYSAAMDTIKWIEVNLHSSLEEYQSRRAQLEEIALPLLTKMKGNTYARDEF